MISANFLCIQNFSQCNVTWEVFFPKSGFDYFSIDYILTDPFFLISKLFGTLRGVTVPHPYFCKIKTLALLHFNLKNNYDFKSQIISCKEWFPPDNYEYCVLKKSFENSIKKIEKRI